MKNIIMTALLVSNLFTAGILYSFTTGHVSRAEPADYVLALSEPDEVRPVKLARK